MKANGSATQVLTCIATPTSAYTCSSLSSSNIVTRCFNAFTSSWVYCLITVNGVGDYGCFVSKINFLLSIDKIPQNPSHF